MMAYIMCGGFVWAADQKNFKETQNQVGSSVQSQGVELICINMVGLFESLVLNRNIFTFNES